MRVIRHLFGFIAVFLFASCAREDRFPDGRYDANAVKATATVFQTKINTEGSGDVFHDGDMFMAETLSENLSETYRSSAFRYENGVWSLADDRYMIWDEGENRFQAWIPVDAGYDSFTVPADQSSVEGLRAADWMTAYAGYDSQPDDNTATFVFAHMLAKVVVTIDSFGSPFTGNETISSVVFSPASSGLPSGVSASDDVSGYVSEKSMVAVLAPGNYAGGATFMKLTLGGEELEVLTPAGGLALIAGNSYTFSLTVQKDTPPVDTPVPLTLGDVTVTGWDKTLLSGIIIPDNSGTPPPVEPEDKEKAALMAIYTALAGNTWQTNTNWGSDRPLGEWEGVEVDGEGKVTGLTIVGSGGSATVAPNMPAELYSLTKLKTLSITRCGNLGGTIPSEIGNLVDLETLIFSNCSIGGSIPDAVGQLLGKKLTVLKLNDNSLTGDVPASVKTNPKWELLWLGVAQGNSLNITVGDLLPPGFNQNDLDGNALNSDVVYPANKYTIIYGYDVNAYPYNSSASFPCNKMHELYDRYNGRGVGLVMFQKAGSETELRNFIDDNALTWPAASGQPYGADVFPSVTVVDENKNVVFTSFLGQTYDDLLGFLKNAFPEVAIYESRDYSKDGQVTLLRASADIVNGIDLIFLGDGYSDRQIANEDYNIAVNRAIGAFFSEEPFSSHINYFNVYRVTVVSKNEGYDVLGETALDGYFGNGSLVGGNDAECIKYAKKAIDETRLDNAIIVVLMNKDAYAGTCRMYNPESKGDYGSGLSISYVPTNSDDEKFKGLMLHEAGGHGFAKLDDEYAYEQNGMITEAEAAEYRKQVNDFGWNKNTDLTGDQTQVKWAHFLEDSRYEYEGLGVFEGAHTYWTGVWRPTENSIMRYNEGGYNAPSREAIYYRIHKLKNFNNKNWTYDYETFVTDDEDNRKTASSTVSTSDYNYVEAPFEPTHPPVIVNKTWREAMGM